MTGILDRALTPIRERMAALESKVRTKASVHSATITSTNPLRFQLDGEDAPKPITPDTLAPVRPGDRVRVLHHGRTSYTILNRVGGTGTGVLDEANLTGLTTGTNLTVPIGHRGTYRKYVIDVLAGASGSTPRPLVVLINGDNDSNYREATSAISTDGTVLVHRGNADTSWPRVGFIGNYRGHLRIEYAPPSLGRTGYIPWEVTGWGNDGSGNFQVRGGGRWLSNVQEITHFTVRTNSGTESWETGSTARLWGYR